MKAPGVEAEPHPVPCRRYLRFPSNHFSIDGDHKTRVVCVTKEVVQLVSIHGTVNQIDLELIELRVRYRSNNIVANMVDIGSRQAESEPCEGVAEKFPERLRGDHTVCNQLAGAVKLCVLHVFLDNRKLPVDPLAKMGEQTMAHVMEQTGKLQFLPRASFYMDLADVEGRAILIHSAHHAKAVFKARMSRPRIQEVATRRLSNSPKSL